MSGTPHYDTDEIRAALVAQAADVGRALLGEPNRSLSNGHQLRWGKKGSMALDITGDKAGMWFDHEAQAGGDLLELIKRERGGDFPSVLAIAAELVGVNPTRSNGAKYNSAPKSDTYIASTPIEARAAPTVFPLWTPPDERGRPKFIADAIPPKSSTEIRRHVYHRGGVPVLVKIKQSAAPTWIPFWRVHNDRGVTGWQAKKPAGYRAVPYVGAIDPFDPELKNDQIYWTEGEKDADTLGKINVPAFTFGGVGDGLPNGAEQFVAGRHIVILSHNDPQAHNPNGTLRFHDDGRPTRPGQDHAERKAALCHPLAASVRVVHFFELPDKGDVSDWIAQGHNLEDLESRADATPLWTPARQQHRFPLIPFDSLTAGADPDYLVKGIIPRVGLVVIWGPPKCGKSFWTFDLLMHVALGREYRGHKVQPGPVVYCAFEGQEGYGKRADAFRQRFLADHTKPVPLHVMPARASLAKDHVQLIAAIEFQLGKTINPTAVVLDTLNRSIDGSESKDEDMGMYVRAADAIREKFNCAVPIVHHCGVEGTRPRGHTSLTGAADAQLAVKRDGTDNVVVTVEWMKDGPEGEKIVSRLELVEVGRDRDGDLKTSCVVIPVEGAAARPTLNRKLSDRQRLALDALINVAAERGAELPARYGLPAGLCAIKVEDWRDELLARGIIDSAGPNPRQEFKRLKERMTVLQLIGVRDGSVWSAAAGQ